MDYKRCPKQFKIYGQTNKNIGTGNENKKTGTPNDLD